MIPLDRSPRGACIFQRILPKEKKCWRADGWWKVFDARGRCYCRVDRIAVRRQSVRLLFSSDPTACYWRSSDRLEPSDNEIGLIGSPFSLYSPNSHAADQTAEKYGRESRDWSVSKTHCHSKTILCNFTTAIAIDLEKWWHVYWLPLSGHLLSRTGRHGVRSRLQLVTDLICIL